MLNHGGVIKMNTIYIIIHDNGYDGYHAPGDYFYLAEQEAQKDCDELNRVHCGADKKYWSYDVHEMTLKTN